MSAITFDKLVYTESLKAGGFSQEQAVAQANALDVALRETVATRADIAEVKNEISELKAEIFKWMFSAMGVQVAVIVALLKLL